MDLKDYFENLGRAVSRLEEVIKQPNPEEKQIYQDAAIQRFEFCNELYGRVLKKFLAYEKVESTTPRDVIAKAYQYKLIDDEKIWLSMMDDHNKTSHVYKEDEAKRVFENIKTYYPTLEKTYGKLKKLFAMK